MSEPKRLMRDPQNKMIAGVCAGLAEYFGLDVTLVRVLYALVTLFTALFGGIIAYIVMWIIIPEKPSMTAAPPQTAPPPPPPST